MSVVIKQEQEDVKPIVEEILIMNYDDGITFEDQAVFPRFIKEEPDTDHIQDDINDVVDIKVEVDEQNLSEENINDDHIRDKNNSKTSDKSVTSDNNLTRKRKRCFDPNKKIQCHECGFKALKKHHLSSHIKQAHPENPPPKQTTFSCDYCMFSSKYKPSLTKHMATFHMDKVKKKDSKASSRKKKSCYDDVEALKIEDHSTLKDGIYSCNYCSQTISNGKVLKMHIAKHVVENTPVLPCPHCPVRYFLSGLQKHIEQVHNPDKVYKCDKCCYVATHKANLRRHKKQNEGLNECRPVQVKKNSYKAKPEDQKKSKIKPVENDKF